MPSPVNVAVARGLRGLWSRHFARIGSCDKVPFNTALAEGQSSGAVVVSLNVQNGKIMNSKSLSSLVAAASLTLMLPVQAQQFPSFIPLPDGWGPEGIATGRGTDFYAGARHLSPYAGAIYKGDLRTGLGDILVEPQPGRAALGLKIDQRSNLLFVAGGPTGAAYVYDGTSGEELAFFQFAAGSSFINDVVITRQAAYFTDSLNAVLYVVPLGPGGRLPDPLTFDVLPLSGDFVLASGFNANGIAATRNGEWLIVVQSVTGLLYRVDPATGFATLIDLDGTVVTSGDGILLDGRTLYVTRNSLNRIAIITLDRTLASGEYVDDITSPDFQVPTTIAEFGNALYAVNAKFGLPIAGTEFEVVRVSK